MESMLIGSVFMVFIALCVNASVIPNQDMKTKRVYETALSDEEHYTENEEHNVDYDHEAFLGEAAKTFDELTPEESKFRLGKMVDKIDSDKDGFVSLQELKDWIQYSQRRYVVKDAERQWQGLNPEGKPKMSWEQYKKLTYGFTEEDTGDETNFQYKDMMERDLRRWKKADQNNDGSLTKDEFVDFVHPEEAEHMKDIVVIETMEDIDRDRDGKVSLDEYIGDMYGDDDIDEEPNWVQNEKEQFTQYRDKNKDGFMDMEEVRKWILPDDYDNSDAEARHLIYESDINRDNKLSKEEILDKYDLFVGSQATDFGEALVQHDEF